MASKQNPSALSTKPLPQGADFRELFIPKLQHDLSDDARAMDSWLAQKQDAYERRYQQKQKSGVNFPWPGASNFNYPAADIEIDQAKPSLLNVVFGGKRIADCIALNPESQAQATKAGQAMEYLLRYRMGERGVPDFWKQTSFSADSFLQHGVSVDKQFYSYLVEWRTESYTRETLPDALKSIQVVDEVSPEEQQQYQQMGLLVVPRKQWAEYAPKVKDLVIATFGFDSSEKSDRVACAKVIDFIKANKPDKVLEFATMAVIEDTPRTVNVPIEQILLPAGARSITGASRVAHDMWFTENDLALRSYNGLWDEKAVQQVMDTAKSQRSPGNYGVQGNRMWTSMEDRSGAMFGSGTQNEDAQFKITEAYCYKRDDHGVPQPVVITLERQSGAVLRAQPYDYAHGAWPFVSSHYEMNDQAYFSSRGIPEKIEGLEKHMTAMMRAELNGLMMATSQSFTYRVNSGINPQKLRWMPHLMIPVRSQDDFKPVPTNTSVLALERPMMMMQNLITKVTGGRMNTTVNEMRQDRPPTATQVSEQSRYSQSSHGLRAMYFQHGRGQIYNQLWSLWQQFGPESFYATVTGEALQKMTQQDIRGDFKFLPVGSIKDMDPGFRTQEAMQMLDVLMRSEPYVQQDPRYVPDMVGAVKEVMDRICPTASARLLRPRSPEEQQQFMEQQQAQAQESQRIAQEAQKLQQGAPITPENALEVLKLIAKQAPHGDLQPLIVQGQQAMTTVGSAIENMEQEGG